ncbi:hypothetical protein EON67_12510 [archaeon]|nr:MAG: hypothetical protein EON67_12510 [archaeon]
MTYWYGSAGDIDTNMRLSLTVDLGREGAILDSFNLYDIGVPAAFTDVRNRYLSAQQEISRAQNDRDVALIQAESNVQVAQREAQLIVSQALITAQSIQITTQAQIAALTARYDTESTSFSALKAALNLNTTELLAYIWLDAQAEGISTGRVHPLVNNAASLP